MKCLTEIRVWQSVKDRCPNGGGWSGGGDFRRCRWDGARHATSRRPAGKQAGGATHRRRLACSLSLDTLLLSRRSAPHSLVGTVWTTTQCVEKKFVGVGHRILQRMQNGSIGFTSYFTQHTSTSKTSYLELCHRLETELEVIIDISSLNIYIYNVRII